MYTYTYICTHTETQLHVATSVMKKRNQRRGGMSQAEGLLLRRAGAGSLRREEGSAGHMEIPGKVIPAEGRGRQVKGPEAGACMITSISPYLPTLLFPQQRRH